MQRDSGQSSLPIVLRKERFGGLLFAPQDAVHIEMDGEAFSFLKEHLNGRRAPATEAETRVLERILAETGSERIEHCRTVEFARDVEPHPFKVYNAPTLADFQITTQCPMACPHCYAASEPEGISVGLAEIERVLDELKINGVAQVAIGGGEPLAHPDLIRILDMCHCRGMVPNLTTNGVYFDPDKLAAMKRYCGAVALSMEGVGDNFERVRRAGFAFFEERLKQLMAHGIATVIQITLSRENFAELDDMVDFCLCHPGLYGVIFLAYKEVGRGRRFHHVLAGLSPRRVHENLRRAFERLSERMRVGYDCCLTPALAGAEPDAAFVNAHDLEGCSAMRSSIGILPNLDVVPCTFTGDIVIGNLGRESLFDIWRREEAKRFRRRFQSRLEADESCAACPAKSGCLGGCPVFDLVGCRYRGT